MDLIMVNRRQAPVHNYPPKLTEPSTHRTEDSVASHGAPKSAHYYQRERNAGLGLSR